jgi:hypothetical protein
VSLTDVLESHRNFLVNAAFGQDRGFDRVYEGFAALD